ncbi:MAG: hypothetical protein WC071_12180, partial [Victivallaceae bacterium]
RVAIPKEWRRRDGETRLILFPGRDKDLLLFPFESFRDFLHKARKVSFANRMAQEALARIGARARDCRCDKQGRITVDKDLLAKAEVKGQLKMIGAMTHIKICAPGNWQEQPLGDDVYLDEVQKISENDDDFMRTFMETFGKST